MEMPDRCKWTKAGPRQDFIEADTLKNLKVDHRPPLVLHIALALQHAIVHTSLCALVVGALVPQAEKERAAASVFFYSGISTLLQTRFGSCLPLIQAPSLDFLVPSLVLLGARAGSHAACRGQCDQSEQLEVPTLQPRELQGIAVIASLVQLSLGLCGVGGAMLARCGPLVLTPVCCMLGFSIYREAALLCSDHWGFALLTVVLLVCLSQHLRCWTLSVCLNLQLYPVISMLSVLLSVLFVWLVCAVLQHCGHISPHSVSELLFKDHLNTTSFQHWMAANSSNLLSPAPTASWFSLPLPGLGLPLLSGGSIAAGIAAGLSSCISSQTVYVLTARLLKAPTPPAQACNRGVSVEGLSSMLGGLMGAPVGLCSSVPNACMISLSQCGSRATVQLAAVMLLVLGLFPQLTQLLTSVPLAIHGAVLSVTYTVAAATGITYLQYTDVDSGRNIFNTGFTMFMSLVLSRWFRLQSGFIYTGVHSLDIFLQSCLMLPVFLVSLLAFLLDHTVSGTMSERGFERDQGTRKIQSLADKPQENRQSLVTVYEPPQPVRKVLDWPGLRIFPFCACRSLEVEKIASAEMSNLLPQ